MSLLDKASLIVTPNSYKESKLYSVVPNTTLGDMDVVRATTATRVNSAGLIEVVPRNLLQFSEQLDNAIWTKSGVTITANSVNSPIGTLTADLVTPTISDASLRQSFLPTAVLQYNFSIWLRSSTGSNFSTTLRAWRDSPFQNISNVVINVTTEWQRFNFSFTTLDATTHVLAIGGSSTLSTGENFYSWGAQLDLGATATEYFPTTTRLNIPRIDYTNGSCPSLLVEPQRTNLYTYSQQLNQWSKSGVITVTENDEISPEGTQNADRAQFTLSTDLLFRSGTGLAGSNTLTVYAKAKSGTSQKFRFFGLGGGTFSSDQVATNQWQRFTFTYTSASTNTAGLSGASTGASDVLFYGFQHEIGAYATSYIPTVASTVTRNADVISKTGISSLIGQTEGTLFVEYYNQLINSTALFLNKNSSNSIAIATTPTGIHCFFICNSIQFQLLISGYTVKNEKLKVAISYNSLGYKLFVNGILKGTNANSIIFSAPLTSVNLNDDAVINLNQTIYNNGVQLYKTALTDTECINLTTL